MTNPFARLRPLLRVLMRSRQLETDMTDEMRFHVEMEADRLARERGLDPQEARRQAYVRFGGIEKYKEAGRDARGRQWLDALSLDSRLGVRMLVKYRGLTVIGGFAMAVAIAIGAIAFETFNQLLARGLPFEDGDRVVSIQYASANPGNRERNLLHDFDAWRTELKTIEQLGAWRTVQHNLASPSAPAEPIKVAEMTASGFAVTRTPPHLGRYLVPADEEAGASPVMVLGYQAWQSRFAADPQIVGRSVMLGGVPYTVVGVMPDGYGFPFDHQFWTPFRANPLSYERFKGPSIFIFGRLAPGITLAQAQAELTTIAQRAAPAGLQSTEPVRPLVAPYTLDHLDLSQPGIAMLLRIVQALTGALVFVVAINLAILVYARTVTRLGEIAVRSALGASRRRILVQLFIESLALSLLGAISGLALAVVAFRYIQWFARANGGVPFWIRFDLSAGTVIDAIAVAIVAAVIMGVLPGLKATGRSLTANLHELNGRAGTRLGAVWTTLVVAQVAIAVAVLPVAFYLAWQVVQMEVAGPGFAAEKFVITQVALPDHNAPADPDLVRRRQLEMMSRLQAEPGVSAVTFSSAVPGFAAGGSLEFEDGAQLSAPAPWYVSTFNVAPDLLDVYGAELLAGRRFTAGDLGTANNVIVNETFARWMSGSGNALGVRFRYVNSAEKSIENAASYQIVGVVRDFPSFPSAFNLDTPAVVYHPAAPGAVNPVILSMRFNGDLPAGFVDRARQIGSEVDPALQVRRAVPLEDYYDQLMSLWRYVAGGVGMMALSVLLLSAAGMYALMSFTVAQRTREIGIRVALGAHPRRLLLSVFARVLRQLGLGIAAGSIMSGLLIAAAGLSAELATPIMLAVAAIMLIAGVLAAVGPARHSLRIHAAEALRADA